MALELEDGKMPERITILADSFNRAAMEYHLQRMSEQGYRVENRICAHTFFQVDDLETVPMFEGATKYAVTFVRDSN